jgi:hypothetical protein
MVGSTDKNSEKYDMEDVR